MRFARAHAVLDAGLAARAFPAVSVEVGRASGVLWREAAGHLHYDADAPPCTVDTIFDLASLTKVIATTTIAMRAVADDALQVDAPVATWLPEWADGPHAAVRVRHLLDHSSGLPAHSRLWELTRGPDGYRTAIHAMPLESPPGAAAVYSDLGFITLGFLLEQLTGDTLERRTTQLLGPTLGGLPLRFAPGESWRPRTARTEFDPWRARVLQGEVHDENAAALGGAAGHAGLFGTAAAVGAVARRVLETFTRDTDLGTPAAMRTMATRSAVPGSSRALGWDTMLPTSSCGTRLSARAIGHTGFTGTSLWIDPERDLYIVLLTNRVCPTRSNDGIRAVRPRFHDAVADDLDQG